MDVLQVTHRYPPAYGGIENYAHRLTKSLREAGHSVTILTTDHGIDGHPPFENFPEASYCETTVTISRNPLSVSLYRRLCRAEADVCHLHSPYLLPTLEAAHALPDDIPVVVTVHGFPTRHDFPSRLRALAYRPFAQYVYDSTDAIIVLGESERNKLLDGYDIDPSSVTVIPNGIEPRACDVPEDAVERFQRTHGLNPETPTVLFVGRLTPWKNPAVLVEAVVEHLPDTALDVLLIGDGESEYAAKLRSEADDRFVFLSELPWKELLPAYHASDLFVLLSRSEGLSTVVLEALNARLPIVTTPVGALADVVDHREHGWVVDSPPDPAAVADAIQHYCAHPDERRCVGERNRAYVRSEFAWEDIAGRIKEVYNRIVEQEDISSTRGLTHRVP